MVCPYTVHRKVVEQIVYEYDEESGNVTMSQTIQNNSAQMIKCAGENCGAWYGGRCHYGNVD